MHDQAARKLAGHPGHVSLGFFMTLLSKTFSGTKTFDQRYRGSDGKEKKL
jgi:hypothetical protein